MNVIFFKQVIYSIYMIINLRFITVELIEDLRYIVMIRESLNSFLYYKYHQNHTYS